MAKAKRYRWECGECGRAKLGTQRPRRDSVVRYCLPCSERTGYLVETKSPVLERKSLAKRVRATKKKGIKRTRESARNTRAGIDVVKETKRVAGLIKVHVPEIVLRGSKKSGATGRSYGGRIVYTIPETSDRGTVLALVSHELAHECFWRAGHSQRWRDKFLEITRLAWGVDPGDPGGSSHDLHRHVIRALNEAGCV